MKALITHITAAIAGAVSIVGFFLIWDKVERQRRGY